MLENRKIQMTAKLRSAAYAVHAWKDEHGVLTVVFFVGGGFPVKHLAYLYRADGRISPEIERDWLRIREKEPKWYVVSD